MLYNLVLVLFLSGDLEHREPLVNSLTANSCVELRDQVRGQINAINESYVPMKLGDNEIVFVDAECVAQKMVY